MTVDFGGEAYSLEAHGTGTALGDPIEVIPPAAFSVSSTCADRWELHAGRFEIVKPSKLLL